VPTESEPVQYVEGQFYPWYVRELGNERDVAAPPNRHCRLQQLSNKETAGVESALKLEEVSQVPRQETPQTLNEY
jgi:hypothetical protein